MSLLICVWPGDVMARTLYSWFKGRGFDDHRSYGFEVTTLAMYLCHLDTRQSWWCCSAVGKVNRGPCWKYWRLKPRVYVTQSDYPRASEWNDFVCLPGTRKLEISTGAYINLSGHWTRFTSLPHWVVWWIWDAHVLALKWSELVTWTALYRLRVSSPLTGWFQYSNHACLKQLFTRRRQEQTMRDVIMWRHCDVETSCRFAMAHESTLAPALYGNGGRAPAGDMPPSCPLERPHHHGVDAQWIVKWCQVK